MWYRCQEIVDARTNNNRKTRLQNNPRFPLRGLLLCSECRGNLTACSPKSPRFRKYYCYSKDCARYSKSVDGDIIEADFEALLRSLKPTEATEKQVKAEIVDRYERRKEEFKTDYIRQMNVIASLSEEEKIIVEQFRKGNLPEHLMADQVKEIEDKIFAEKQKLNNVFEKEVNIRELIDFAFNFFRTLDIRWKKADFEPKLMLQRFLFREKIAYNVLTREFSLLEPSISPLLRLDQISGGH